jgi:hypothetical protein
VGLAVGEALGATLSVCVGAVVLAAGDALRRTTFSTARSTDWIGAGTFSPHATSVTARSATATRLLTEQGC